MTIKAGAFALALTFSTAPAMADHMTSAQKSSVMTSLYGIIAAVANCNYGEDLKEAGFNLGSTWLDMLAHEYPEVGREQIFNDHVTLAEGFWKGRVAAGEAEKFCSDVAPVIFQWRSQMMR